MYRINTLNKIDPKGLSILKENYDIDSDEVAEGLILRSYKLHDYSFPDELLAVARAGAGVNNIPIEKCTKKGIVVFNTPGANANGVKEAVLTGMLISSRDVVGAINWIKGADTSELGVAKTVEKNKSNFKGIELKEKTLGVIGLGAIGVLVANMAVSLGMRVVGYDPYLSQKSKESLDSQVLIKSDLDEVYKNADFISLHLPLLDSTKGFIDSAAFAKMKKGVVLLNFARGGLVNDDDLKQAVSNKIIRKYVTDFPNESVLGLENVIAIPHLGASTDESEVNCAVMAANELKDFLENGNVKNSVNIPDCNLGKFYSAQRVCILGKKESKSEVEKLLLGASASISKEKNGLFYAIYDFESIIIDDKKAKKIEAIDGVLRLRALYK